MRFNENGAVIYRGPSQIDGKPIVVIATGLSRPSDNVKTGDMVQTWILRDRVSPIVAINNGGDESICGSCPLRGLIKGGRNVGRACYVSVRNAPNQVWRSFKAGSYREHMPDCSGRMVRLGAYGDPCAVPYHVWRELLRGSIGHTGYTHQWRIGKFWRFRRLVMASVESVADRDIAWQRGWRTFRTSESVDPEYGEFSCPASAEAGNRLTCETCGACNGSGNNPQRASVTIQAHGSPGVLSSYHKIGV